MDFDAVWNRIKIKTGLKTFIDLANEVSVLQSAISKRRKSGQFPAEWIFIISDKHSISADYLAWGKVISPDTETDIDHKQLQVIDETQEEPVNIQELQEMTTAVLESDTIYRAALAANIRAFYRSVKNEEEKLEMNEHLQRMEAKHDADMMELKALILAISQNGDGTQEDEKKSQAA